MRAKVTKVFRFEAAHHLPNHDGKCREPHGHSYMVEVTCFGQINHVVDDPKEGMVIDFAEIKDMWEAEIKPLLDHKDLNVSLKDWIPVTTAECIAAWILATFRNNGVPVRSVAVWETATSCAEVNFSEVFQDGALTTTTAEYTTTASGGEAKVTQVPSS